MPFTFLLNPHACQGLWDIYHSNVNINATTHFPIYRTPAKKTEKLTALLQPFNAPEIAVFDSPTSHYRMRAEFRIWHDKGDFYHIMFDQSTLQRYRVDEFPIASELINRMMKALLPLLKMQEVLHKKLFQIDYLSTLSNKIIVSLLYHKQLTEEWQSAAANLKCELQQLGFDVQLIGRASKQKNLV